MSPEVIDAIGKWLELAVTVLGAMLFALWAGTIVWTINDMRARSFDLGAIVLAAALAALVPFVGPVVYLLVRPKETLADVYDRALEEDALLNDRSVRCLCPACDAPAREEWAFCPECQHQLLVRCNHCGQSRRADWKYCAYCRAPKNAPSLTSGTNGAPRIGSGEEGPQQVHAEFVRPTQTSPTS